jgi:LacI family transcriptional regulator
MILQRHGFQPAGTAIPPETELAREFGVSRVTVARALNDLVREGILDRHQGKGTFLSERRGRSATQCIGILCSHEASQTLSDPFYGAILGGAQETLISADYSVTAIGIRNTKLGRVLTPEEALAKSVDGLIVLNVMNPEYFVRLLKGGIPIIGVEFHFEAEAPTDYVVQDCEESAFDATRRLIERGHRRIAFFGHATRNVNPVACPDQNSLERLAGVRRAFQSAGIAPSEDLFFQPPHPYWSSTETLFQHIFSRPLPPTAIFCEAGGSLQDVVNFLRSQGREADEFPVFVTDGSGAARDAGPSALRIHEDWSEMGRIAGKRMLARLEQPSLPPQTFKIPWRLELPPDI